MKTITDLNALTSELIDMVLENPEIGTTYYGQSECDYDQEWCDNYVCYEKDGWCIDIEYKCTGEYEESGDGYETPRTSLLVSAYGEVTAISATHNDEVTGETTEFNDEELQALRDAINEALECII